MLERLQLAHPDLYTLPNFAEIQSFVSQCFNREKEDRNSEEPIPNSTGRRWHQKGNGVVEVTQNDETMLEEAIEMIVRFYGGNILPKKYVLSRLRDQFSTATVDSRKANHKTHNKKEVGGNQREAEDAHWINRYTVSVFSPLGSRKQL
jgi:hypothetical protein